MDDPVKVREILSGLKVAIQNISGELFADEVELVG